MKKQNEKHEEKQEEKPSEKLMDSEEDYLTAGEQSEDLENLNRTSSEAQKSDAQDSNEEVYYSSDDEAPEEEAVRDSEDQHKLREREQQQAAAAEAQQLRQKRRAQDAKFKQQKQQKKKLEVPDVLPDELLDALSEEQHSVPEISKNRKTVFDQETPDVDVDENSYLDAKIRATKKKIVKEMNRNNKTVGQINVRLLNSQKKKSALAPAAVSNVGSKTGSVVALRNKWLKRNSLQKKRRY